MDSPERLSDTLPPKRRSSRWLVDMMSRPAEPKWLRTVNALGAVAMALILAGGGTWLIAHGNVLAGLWVLVGVPGIYAMVRMGR